MHTIKNKALGICFVSILFNLSLTLLKLVVGLVGHSYALVSDAIHSSADIFSSVIVAVGVRMAGKPADEDHPMGHEKFECVTAIIIAIVLLITGLTLGCSSISAISDADTKLVSAPTFLAVVMAVIPIIAKELMFRFEERMAEKLSSDALHADALHHRADEWVSLGVLAGVAGGHFGYSIIDTLAGFLVSLLILKAAFDIFYDGVCKMIDKSAPEELGKTLQIFITDKLPDDVQYKISVRMFGSLYVTDLVLYVDEKEKTGIWLELAEYLNEQILCNFNKIKCCNITFKPL